MSRDAITKLEQERQKKQIEQTLEEASWDIPRLLKINARLVKEKQAQAEQIQQRDDSIKLYKATLVQNGLDMTGMRDEIQRLKEYLEMIQKQANNALLKGE